MISEASAPPGKGEGRAEKRVCEMLEKQSF